MNRAESYARLKARRPGIEFAEKEIAPIEAIADLVLDARIRASLSQAELAKLAGTTQARISEIESGEANPKLETLMKIGEALGSNIDLTELLYAAGRVYLGQEFVAMKTPVSAFETEVTLGAAETSNFFKVTADAGLPLFDAASIVVGPDMPAGVFAKHYIAPGFITLKDVAFANGITFMGGSALDTSLLSIKGVAGITYSGVVTVRESDEEDGNNGDDGDEPQPPAEQRTAENSELALAA